MYLALPHLCGFLWGISWILNVGSSLKILESTQPNACRLPAYGPCRELGGLAGCWLCDPVLSSLTRPAFCVQAAMENLLEQRLYQPQKLLEDLRGTDAQQFHTAMKCLLEDKKDHLVRLSWHPGSGRSPGHSTWCLSSWMELCHSAFLHFLPENSLGPRFSVLLPPEFKWNAL